MTGRPIFDGFSGPAGLIDRMIGEEYTVVKSVAEKLEDLATIVSTIEQIEDIDALLVALTAAKDAAALSATSADTSEGNALIYKDATDAFRAQAQGFSTTASASQVAAAASQASAAGSASGANNSSVSAAISQTAAQISATAAQDWAVKTSSEVVLGQGFGSKKYSIDAASSALQANGSASVSEIARLAAVAAKDQAVAIAGFDVNLYSTKVYMNQRIKRAITIYGNR